jgi:diacylglycerol kinase (ATP)
VTTGESREYDPRLTIGKSRLASRSYFVIFNPAASRGGAAGSRGAIERAFRASAVEFEIVPTERRGHGAELAERAVGEGWSAVVAVGGDGIVHEVVNGLMRVAGEGETVPLGVIPVGSGNDFIKMLRLPAHDPAAAVRQLVAARVRKVDIGRVTRHHTGGGPEGVWYFTNGIGVGFDAQVATHARAIRKLRGVAIYAWALVKTLRDLRSPRIAVRVDGREIADRPLILTTVSNGPCHGGSFWLCPGASIDDGQLDVLIANARPLAGVLKLLPRVLFGKHLRQPGVELHRGTSVEVRSDTPLPIHADGEIVAEWVRELVIDVLPRRLAVLSG